MKRAASSRQGIPVGTGGLEDCRTKNRLFIHYYDTKGMGKANGFATLATAKIHMLDACPLKSSTIFTAPIGSVDME